MLRLMRQMGRMHTWRIEQVTVEFRVSVSAKDGIRLRSGLGRRLRLGLGAGLGLRIMRMTCFGAGSE